MELKPANVGHFLELQLGPVTRIKCGQFTFLQTTKVFNLYVLYIPRFHNVSQRVHIPRVLILLQHGGEAVKPVITVQDCVFTFRRHLDIFKKSLRQLVQKNYIFDEILQDIYSPVFANKTRYFKKKQELS